MLQQYYKHFNHYNKMQNKENIIFGTLGGFVGTITTISGLDIVQSLLTAFLCGVAGMVGKDFYKKLKEK